MLIFVNAVLQNWTGLLHRAGLGTMALSLTACIYPPTHTELSAAPQQPLLESCCKSNPLALRLLTLSIVPAPPTVVTAAVQPVPSVAPLPSVAALPAKSALSETVPVVPVQGLPAPTVATPPPVAPPPVVKTAVLPAETERSPVTYRDFEDAEDLHMLMLRLIQVGILPKR